jgi:hypothetical protein
VRARAGGRGRGRVLTDVTLYIPPCTKHSQRLVSPPTPAGAGAPRRAQPPRPAQSLLVEGMS